MENIENVPKKTSNEQNRITIEDFLKNYRVRDMLAWRKFGMQHLYKLAEALEQEGYYLRF